MTRRTFVSATVTLTLLVMIAQAVWAFVMPPFRGPDEPHHVNSIFRLASDNGWPEPGEAMVDPVIVSASKEAGLLMPTAGSYTVSERTQLYRGSITPQSFATAIVTAYPNRSAIGEVAAADPMATVRDQMTQHPPLYYAGGALVAKVAGLADMPWDRSLFILRLYSILWVMPLLPSMVYAARKFGARREWALLAGLIPFAIPQVSAVAGTVTNDAMVLGTGGLAMAAMIKAATEKFRWSNAIIAGLAVGLALWSKGQMLALGLPLALIFFLKKTSFVHRFFGALLAGVVALGSCPWWIMNLVRYGALQPDGFQRTPAAGWDPATASPWKFFEVAWATMSESFVARFGWLEVDMNDFFVYNLLIALLLFFIIGFIRSNHKATIAILASALIGILIVIVRQSWTVYVETGAIAGVQGRYLYPFLTIFVVCVFGLAAVKNPRRTFRITGLVIIAYNLIGLVALFYASYYGDPVNLERFSFVVGRNLAICLLVLGFYLAATLIIALIVWRAGGSVAHPEDDEARLPSGPFDEEADRVVADRNSADHEVAERDDASSNGAAASSTAERENDRTDDVAGSGHEVDDFELPEIRTPQK